VSRINWLFWVASTVLVVVPVPVHAGGLSKRHHAAFTIKLAGAAAGIKAQLWDRASVAAISAGLSIKREELWSSYPWKITIVATVFWIGETGNGPTNTQSAWDTNWVRSYGGVDDPVRRNGYEPSGFRPLENPFYVALPYCDMQSGRLKPEAAKVVPWFIAKFRGIEQSVCKGRWLEIRHGPKICYAQWEDVGPFHTDLAAYVFGAERPSPNLNHSAGIDVSPAVRDYLELSSLELVDWRFVEQIEVPIGPWSLYKSGETPELNR
jgi:hypothetical protein